MKVEKWEMPFKTAYERAKEYESVIQRVCAVMRSTGGVVGDQRDAYNAIQLILEEKGWL